ncbi:hypothetical protein [Methanoplanus endosymbiosus]|uniref:Uncharacterized protein n=1 Tax=Methanoplanus endosymbiosus TaxID=33865 RepID=A0A9E7TH65_9EURY|nr:hypothetical protein [Methanoplanus endosymbiosus]UUX92322.1 hypothetical protein L6E24_13435 [Methanoplanus endosymbiosus]
MNKFKKSIFCGIILLLVMITGIASAVSVSVSPDYIDEGDTVTISFQDLNDNSTFALRMQSVIGIGNETSFQFEATNVNVPFSMSDPEVYVQAEPVNSAGLKATSGGSIKSIEYIAGDDKIVDFSQGLDNLGAGSIEALRVFGETDEDNQNIDISLQLEGIKTGPTSGSISFGLSGIESGSAWIYIFVDGSEVTGKEIIIGEPPVTATPTAVPSSGGSSDSSRDSSDDEPTSEATSSATAEPTETTVNTDEASSMDGIATVFFREDAISGAVPEQVFITKVTPKEIPSDWQAVSEGYIISPSSAKFSPDATLTIRMNESISSQASVLRPFLVKYTGNDWTIMPSVISGNAVKTDIDTTGQYALVIIGDGGQTSSGGTTGQSGSSDYSGQQESPTQASGMSAALIPAFIGILAGILLLTGRRD